ncbi:unnamed protein product [Didymodactylos carnosus]|uniref:Uncharacterized protein n=1 Tax=Didymodactylos carnosus TaxID=1234261 RepID=A0A815XKI1_9BILA|nr:unnamed protein product [Didymodactylos carnosus]CAF1558500.1 unnamed protein product [Didymodactylos carnosus]CAF4055146.1 unnamed protein product [Didymodactylos carnosus]CAF4419846.1 unnamed protein product [Didymodactylos carnosus]
MEMIKQFYIVFERRTGTGTFNMAIDDIRIVHGPCLPLTSTSISSTSSTSTSSTHTTITDSTQQISTESSISIAQTPTKLSQSSLVLEIQVRSTAPQ